MTDSPVGSVTGVFSSFNLTNNLPRLRADDGHSVLVGVPRGALEDFARACHRNRTRVEISGPVNEKDGVITAINLESIRVVAEKAADV